MQRIRRHVPFLRSLVHEALVRAANADQINAVSELVLNALTNPAFPIPPDTVAQLRPHKKALRDLRRKKHLVKRRREVLLQQKDGCFWTSLDQLCRCLNVWWRSWPPYGPSYDERPIGYDVSDCTWKAYDGLGPRCGERAGGGEGRRRRRRRRMATPPHAPPPS